MGASSQQRRDLTDSQFAELKQYADGKPLSRGHRRYPSANLIRRGLLMHVAPHGSGLYQLTEFGRAVLRERIALEEFPPPPAETPLEIVAGEMLKHRAGTLHWRSFFLGVQIGRLPSLEKEAVRECVQTYFRGIGLKRKVDR
jgi:hypothetical protein